MNRGTCSVEPLLFLSIHLFIVFILSMVCITDTVYPEQILIDTNVHLNCSDRFLSGLSLLLNAHEPDISNEQFMVQFNELKQSECVPYQKIVVSPLTVSTDPVEHYRLRVLSLMENTTLFPSENNVSQTAMVTSNFRRELFGSYTDSLERFFLSTETTGNVSMDALFIFTDKILINGSGMILFDLANPKEYRNDFVLYSSRFRVIFREKGSGRSGLARLESNQSVRSGQPDRSDVVIDDGYYQVPVDFVIITHNFSERSQPTVKSVPVVPTGYTIQTDKGEMKYLPVEAVDFLVSVNPAVRVRSVELIGPVGSYTSPSYRLSVSEERKFLGLFDVTAEYDIYVSAVDLSVSSQQPWWYFLTSSA